MATPAQVLLFEDTCACGSEAEISGYCAGCYWAHRNSLRFFGGNRETVVSRDRYCQGCLAQGQIVHHRIPGKNGKTWLVYLCRGCHARIHHLRFLRYFLPERLVYFWMELHPDRPVQLQMDIAPRYRQAR